MSRACYGNGKIFTGQDETTFASALVVEDGRVTWTGQTAALGEAYVDLRGSTVVPGFIDAHIHPSYVARVQQQVACLPPRVNSIRDMVAALRAALDERDPRVWVCGWGFDESKLAERRTPSREDLDRVSTSHPVEVTRSDFHSRVVNSRALALAGITRATPEVAHGVIGRRADGEPNGYVAEAAVGLIDRVKPPVTRDQAVQSLCALSRRWAGLGLTGAVEIAAKCSGDDDAETYREARARGFRQHLGLYYDWRDLRASGRAPPAATADPEAGIRINGLKLFLDGSISGRTAYLEEPYRGAAERGCLFGTREELLEAYECARGRGLQLAVHAMGDAAIQLVIDTLRGKRPWVQGAPAVRIEHASILSPEMMRQIAEAGFGMTQQVIFLFAEYDSYRQNLSDRQLEQTCALRSLYRTVEHVCLSSDSPATLWEVPEDVFVSIQAAVTRRAYAGQDINQEQRITVPQALLLYTRKAAAVARLPGTGQLLPGYAADFVVLDRDIFTVPPEELDQVRAEQTYIGGELVHPGQ